MVEFIMLIIILVEQLGNVLIVKGKCSTRVFFYCHVRKIYFFSTTAQRPQPQVSNRHQIDDVDSSQSQTGSLTGSRGAIAAAAAAATNTVSDDLGPLPPGWQQSRTENDRLFFIDHINKRTTWVRQSIGKSPRVVSISSIG